VWYFCSETVAPVLRELAQKYSMVKVMLLKEWVHAKP
jgi:hypothetical protein